MTAIGVVRLLALFIANTNALCQVMAQLGMLVPAARARLVGRVS
jgi:hypothetical protein